MRAKLDPVDGLMQMRILVDRTSIEIFGNDGRLYMPVSALPRGGDNKLEIFTEGDETTVRTLRVRELQSIWH